MLALLALLVVDVSVGAQFPVPWGGLLTLRGAASFCLDFFPPPGSCGRHLAGKRYTGFMLQTLGLPLPGDYGQVPAKLWYLHKV